MKKLVILTGAGISAESGIRTFRDAGGLWEDHDVMDVASYDGWLRNPQLVLKFYNDRRIQLSTVEPHAGHYGLAKLEEYFDVHIITQNVDNLHERAGSTKILHLHGELTKACSVDDHSLVTDIGTSPIHWGDTASDGAQLRPYIVWFGEAVPAIEEGISIAQEADVFVVVGTSLNVYPAASLIQYAPVGCPVYLVDPDPAYVGARVQVIAEPASTGVPKLKQLLLDTYC